MEFPKQPKPAPPAGLTGAYFALSVFTFAACFVAPLGIFVVPCALAALALGLHTRSTFSVGWQIVACQCALVLALLIGISYLQKLDRAIEQERRELDNWR